MESKVRKHEPRKKLIDVVPQEGKDAIQKFNDAYKIFFKNQTHAGEVLKVRQGTINRYLSGALLVPLEVAQRFEIFTKGVIPAQTIFFDYQAYLYDLKQQSKQDLKSKK